MGDGVILCPEYAFSTRCRCPVDRGLFIIMILLLGNIAIKRVRLLRHVTVQWYVCLSYLRTVLNGRKYRQDIFCIRQPHFFPRYL